MKDNSLREIEKIILKIFSLILAIGLWIFISYTLNPEITKTFSNVDIKYTMPEDDSIVILNEYPKTCDIDLKGKRNDIIALSKNDIKLNVDLRYVTTMDKDFKLEVKYPLKKNISLVGQEYEFVSLELDDYISKEIPVDYLIEDLTKTDEESLQFKISPEVISVNGAKSEIAKIKNFNLKYKKADLFRDKSEDISKLVLSLTPTIELVDPEKDSLDRKFVDYNAEQVALECYFLSRKKVDLVYDDDYFMSDYLEVLSHSLSLNKIEVVGPPEVLKSIEHVKCRPIIDEEITSSGDYKFLVEIDLPIDTKNLSKQDIYLSINVGGKLDESEL